MKALSIKQPWASLVAFGLKTIELRTWRTSHRGPFVVCASSRYDRRPFARDVQERFDEEREFPVGVCVAVVDLVDVRRPIEGDSERAQVSIADDDERTWCWILERPRLIRQLPVKGALGVFNLDHFGRGAV